MLKFERVYIGGNGEERPCYNLPRMECDLVISGYSVKYRLAIIKRWHELEAASKKPKTQLQLAREQVALLEHIEDLKLKHREEIIGKENKILDLRFELVDIKESQFKERVEHGMTGLYNLPRT